MITATAWVPRGHAAEHPTKYDFNQDEVERISKLAQLRLDDARQGLEEAQRAASDARDIDAGDGEEGSRKSDKKQRNKSGGAPAADGTNGYSGLPSFLRVDLTRGVRD